MARATVQALFDTDVVLDVLMSREPFATEAELVWRALGSEKLTGYIAAITVTNAQYLIRKYAGLEIARNSIQKCLDTFIICPINQEVLTEALALKGSDYEDNVQIVCAMHFDIDAIITRDKAGFKHSPVPVFTPAEVLTVLSASAQ